MTAAEPQRRAFVLLAAVRPAFFRFAPVVADVGAPFSIERRSWTRVPTRACEGDFFLVLAMWRYPSIQGRRSKRYYRRALRLNGKVTRMR
jgi:hypothetical protein